jgi:hypothetical protein
MTVDERLEYLLKVQESHEADLSRLVEAQAHTDTALARFISRTDEVLNAMARILQIHEHRLTDLEGGAQ